MPALDAVTSLFAGCVIFATLGYMAHETDVEIENVVAQGKGFIVEIKICTYIVFQ